MVSPEVSLVLHKANGGEEIVEACNYAIRIISEENTFDENDPCVIHELENIASALMRILITSYNDASTLCKATETVQTLVLKCPLLKRQLAVKGLYTSIMNLGATTIKPHIHQPPINDQTTLFACVMRLLVCLTEDCIENIYQCKQQDIMALIKHCFTEFETIKELMEMTVRLLALLVTDDLFRGIGPTSKVAKDFSSYQKEWRDELCKTRVSTLPIEHFILTLMNRYLADDKNIQMESIKLLNILSQTEGSLDGIRSFGGVDSTLHAIEHYMGCDIILKQGLKLALRLIDGIQYSEVMEIKKDAVFSLMSKVLFANDKKINLEDESFYYLCEIFLVSIENNRNLDTCIVGLSSIFHRLFEKALHAYSHESGDEDWMKEKFSSVAKFLLKVLFFKDFRNRLLIEACKNAHTSLALFLICTGADCSCTYDLQSTTALTAACETNHTTLVCTILALLTNQHNNGTTSKKIKNIETCIRLSLINGNDSITSALLRFLVWSNTNETVDWKKLKLTRIKPDWIATAFCQKIGVEEVQSASLIRNVLTFSMYICTFYGKGKGLVSALEGTSAAFERSMKSEQTWKSTNDLFKVSPVKEIKVLDFSYNEMTELSFIEEINEDVRKCFSSIVEVVNLSNNNLPHAPIEHFKVFKSITVLNLSKNCLSKFPAQVIFNCECLRKLDLSENQIKNIEFGEDIISRSGRYSPENYLQHNNLEMINLQHNCLTLFPLQNLCCFPMLAELNISHNKIVDFGSFTYDSTSLKHMQKLNLSHNCLGKFYPICVEKMFPNLEILSLSQNCSIEFMGNSVLSTNSITTLKLGNCNIETIPIFIQYLPNLEILHLQENSLVNINCLILWRSSKLMEFDLCGNHLNDINVMIDHMITKYCSSMKNLNLSKNYINFLPSKIGNLQFLEELDVTGNIITSIPCEVGKLKCLISLKFDHDKCNGQWKGTAKKTRHFLYNQMKNSVHDYQVSVIFCGERNSGKTTLIQSLIKANMGVFHKEESASRESENFRKTKSYKFCIKHHKSGRSIYIHAHDLMGNEKVYRQHPIFVTSNILYVVVYDSSNVNNNISNTRAWIEAIRSRTFTSPIILVGTNPSSVSKEELDELTQIMKKWPIFNLDEQFNHGSTKFSPIQHRYVDITVKSDVTQLSTCISEVLSGSGIQRAPLIGSLTPINYTKLNEMLESASQYKSDFPVLSLKEMVDMIQEKCEAEFENKSDIFTAIKHLHQKGHVIHFDDYRDELKDYIFIHPPWLWDTLCQITTSVLNKFEFENSLKLKETISSYLSESEELKPLKHKNWASGIYRLLKHFGIVLKGFEDKYFVPSSLPSNDSSLLNITKDLPPVNNKRFLNFQFLPTDFWCKFFVYLLTHKKQFSRCHEGAKMETHFGSNFLYLNCKKMSKESDCWLIAEKKDCDCIDNESKLETRLPLHGTVIEITFSDNLFGQKLLGFVIDFTLNLMEECFPTFVGLGSTQNTLVSHFASCSCTSPTSNEIKLYEIDVIPELIKNSKVDDHRSASKTLEDDVKLLIPLMDTIPDISFRDFDSKYLLNQEELSFSKEDHIGEGAYGNVYRAKYRNKTIALKVFRPSMTEKPSRALRKELGVLGRLISHPNIVELVGILPDFQKNCALGLEFAEYGSLGDLLQHMTKNTDLQSKDSKFPKEYRHRIMYDIANGMKFLHKNNIIFRDLKPDNVILFSLNPNDIHVAKLIDFGISTFKPPNGIISFCGSPGYSAPEVLQLQGNGLSDHYIACTKKCDVFSYGLITHEIAIGRTPWMDFVDPKQNTNTRMVRENMAPSELIKQGILPSEIKSYDGTIDWPYAQQIIHSCLKRNPSERPRFSQIVKFLSDIQARKLRTIFSVSQHSVVDAVFGCKKKESAQDETLFKNPTLLVCHLNNSVSTKKFEKTFSPSSLILTEVNLERNIVTKEQLFAHLPKDFTFNHLITILPAQPSANKITSSEEAIQALVVILGTQCGHIAICKLNSYQLKTCLPNKLQCMHYYRNTSSSRRDFEFSRFSKDHSGFVLAGSADSKVFVYSLTQMLTSSLSGLLHIIDLYSPSVSSVCSINSVNENIYVCAGNSIYDISFKNTENPFIVDKTIIPSKRQMDTGSRTHIAVGKNILFASSKVLLHCWNAKLRTGWLSTTDIRKSYPSRERNDDRIQVSAMFFDNFRKTLWIGSDTGHILIYVASSLLHGLNNKAVAMFKRFSSSVNRFIHFEGKTDEDCSEIVLCVGNNLIPLEKDLCFSKSQKPIMSLNRPTLITDQLAVFETNLLGDINF